jgi:hypothetical protein
LLLGPSIGAVSRTDLHVLQDDVRGRECGSLIRDGDERLFVVVRAEQALHFDAFEHPLVVERMYRVRNTGAWPGAASTVTKLGLTVCCK